MLSDGVPVPLDTLCQGYCTDSILVKVDRQFSREVVHYFGSEDPPLREFVSLEAIVFDQMGGRMIIVMKSDEVIDFFSWRLLEDSCYWLSSFFVRADGKGMHNSFHIELFPNSIVEDSVDILPKHCFKLLTPTDVACGVPEEWGFVDVCGVLKDVYPQTWGRMKGLPTKELTVELEGNNTNAGWGVKKVFCKLHGEVAEATFRAYNSLTNKERVFVVVQYAVGSMTHCTSGAILFSFSDATRVLFNPEGHDVQHIRDEMLAPLANPAP